MHLGNGAITPDCSLFTWGAATAGLGIAAFALRQEKLTADRALAAGGLTAAVFAAQMFNIQVMPQDVSGHFLGGTLLAWTLGPAGGSCLMALVLLVQGIVLGDGSLAAWGANVINMALLPAGLVYVARRALSADSSALVRGLTLAGVSAAAVIGAAMLVVLEVVFSRGFSMVPGLGSFTEAMFVNHLVIAVAEAALTVGLIAFLSGREFSIGEPANASGDRIRASAALLLALVLVPLAITFGSTLPDGYEAAATSSSLENVLAISCAGEGVELSVVYQIVIGVACTLAVGVVGGLLALTMARRDELDATAS